MLTDTTGDVASMRGLLMAPQRDANAYAEISRISIDMGGIMCESYTLHPSQVGPDDLRRNALAGLLVQCLKREAFYQLRTVEQVLVWHVLSLAFARWVLRRNSHGPSAHLAC